MDELESLIQILVEGLKQKNTQLGEGVLALLSDKKLTARDSFLRGARYSTRGVTRDFQLPGYLGQVAFLDDGSTVSDDKRINTNRTYGIVLKTGNVKYNFMYNQHLKLFMTRPHLPLCNTFDTIPSGLVANRRSQDLFIAALRETTNQTAGVDRYYERVCVVLSTLLPNTTETQKKALSVLVFLCDKIRNRRLFGYPIEECVSYTLRKTFVTILCGGRPWRYTKYEVWQCLHNMSLYARGSWLQFSRDLDGIADRDIWMDSIRDMESKTKRGIRVARFVSGEPKRIHKTEQWSSLIPSNQNVETLVRLFVRDSFHSNSLGILWSHGALWPATHVSLAGCIRFLLTQDLQPVNNSCLVNEFLPRFANQLLNST